MVAADPGAEGKWRSRAGDEATVCREQVPGGVEQALLEEPEAVADLVDHARPLAPHLVGLPEDRDLLREARLDRLALVRGKHGVVERRQQVRHAHVRLEQCAPGRLGRVCGEDELERDVGEPPAQLVLGHGTEQLEGFFQRLALDLAGLRVFTTPSDAVMLLGRVRELEVEGERAKHLRLVVRQERPHRLTDDRRVADLARAPRARTDTLLRGEERLAFLLDEHLPEQRAEQPHVATQRAERLVLPRPAPRALLGGRLDGQGVRTLPQRERRASPDVVARGAADHRKR